MQRYELAPATEIMVERREAPLYDFDVWSGSTRDHVYFANPLGIDTASGAVGTEIIKKQRQTNMVQGGYLPKPRFFMVEGIRLQINEAPQTTSKQIRIATFTTGDYQQTLTNYLLYNCFFYLQIGNKRYAEGPAFLFPGNLGIAGQVAAMSVGQRVENINSTAHIAQAATQYGAGRYWDTSRYPLMITHQQQVKAKLAAELSLDQLFPPQGEHRFVGTVLDGIHGREVQ